MFSDIRCDPTQILKSVLYFLNLTNTVLANHFLQSLLCSCFQEVRKRYKTMTKTRKFVVDGEVVISQSSKVIVIEDEAKKQLDLDVWQVHFIAFAYGFCKSTNE